jgi:steroid 5-alpha reductase family enzyme
MPLYLLTLMVYFNNWSTGMWMYFVLHGSYGLIWVLKGMIFPDNSFEQYVSITCAVQAWLVVLGPYCIAGYKIASRSSILAQEPHPERLACAALLYIFGLMLMLCTDAQKYFVLRERKGLITHGFNAMTRNCNYLGEIMLYASFNVIAQVQIVWYVYLFVWGVVFPSRMAAKDYSLSKKNGWEEYRRRTWILLPKLFNSSALSYLIYASLCLAARSIYSLGGV